MRYELDGNGYVCKVFFGCFSGTCTEYTGTIPEGYETLEDWAVSANIRAYKIVDGNLAYDAERDEELQTEWSNGWKTADLGSYFKSYDNNSANTPEYRKTDRIVEIRGTVTPASAIGAGVGATIFTLPEGYRPSKDIHVICQGSSRNVWLLVIKPTGNVNFSRYGTSSYIETPVGAWLPFNWTFLVD